MPAAQLQPVHLPPTAPRIQPSSAYSVTVRFHIAHRPGTLGRLTTAIGEVGGDIAEVRVISETRAEVIREITIDARDAAHQRAIIAGLQGRIAGVTIAQVVDNTFALHRGGKLEVHGKAPLQSPVDLARAYTPGVARVCQAIGEQRDLSHTLTIRRNTVAVVSDGTAILGLGDLGPEAAMPVMEGKCQLFKEFGGVDAVPLCLATKDVDDIVRLVRAVAPSFGGINLEDISAPRCFAIEERLQDLGIPVFHDDQHGTAVVMLAALTNALTIVGKRMQDITVVVCGVGAAGVACSKILLDAGVRHLIGCDRSGAIYAGRTDNMNPIKEWYAQHTNPEGRRGQVSEVISGADVFIGLSAPGMITVADVQRMAPSPIVFAMANPIPEIMPEDAAAHVAVMATGRSDYPNQINNVLAFPGIFRGALDVCATRITPGMKLAASRAIADLVDLHHLTPDLIIPSPFDRRVGPAVAAAVARQAVADGVARPHLTHDLTYDHLRW